MPTPLKIDSDLGVGTQQWGFISAEGGGKDTNKKTVMMHSLATNRTIDAQFYFILSRRIMSSMHKEISTTNSGIVMTKTKP